MLLSYQSADLQQKLHIYRDLLIRWSASLNLVAKSTLPHIQQRHFEDSLQLVPLILTSDKVADIGAGAGFPGMVLALCGFDITLVESDQKKCVFLENVSRETNSKVKVICSRIENYLPSEVDRFDVVCSRGLAPLSDLILMSRHLIKKSVSKGLFLKGENVDREISEINLNDQNRIQKINSSTNSNSSVIVYQF